MKKRAVMAFIPVVLCAGFIMAGNIVSNPANIDSLYSDHKAYKAGDIVTVIVIESPRVIRARH